MEEFQRSWKSGAGRRNPLSLDLIFEHGPVKNVEKLPFGYLAFRDLRGPAAGRKEL